MPRLVFEKGDSREEAAKGAAASAAKGPAKAATKAAPPRAARSIDVRAGNLRGLVDGFAALAAKIKKAGLEVTFVRGDGATPEHIAAAEKARGKRFPRPLKSLLGVANGFRLVAEPRVPGDDPLYYRAWSTDEYVGAGEGRGIFWFEEDDDGRDFVVVVDVNPNGIHSGYVVDGEPEDDPPLAYHENGDSQHGVDATLEEYLQAALAKGSQWLQAAQATNLSERALVARLASTVGSFSFVQGHGSASFTEGANPSLADLRTLGCKQVSLSNAPHDFDLASLAKLPGLTRLSLGFRSEEPRSGHALAAWSSPGFPALQSLRLDGLCVASLAFLRWFPALEDLHIIFPRVDKTSSDTTSKTSALFAELDAGALGSLKTLFIDLEVDSFAFLKACPNLEKLEVRSRDEDAPTPAGYLGPIELPERLRELSIPGQGLTRVPDLRGADGLTRISLDNNALGKIANLERFKHLRDVSICDTRIASLDGLKHATELESLSVGGNPGLSLGGLERFTKLRLLRADTCSLDQPLDLSALEHLEDLHVAENRFTAAPHLAATAPLRELRLQKNQLTAPPDLSTFPALTRVYLGENQLTRVPRFAKGVRLEVLDLEANPIDDFAGLDFLPTSCSVSLQRVPLSPKGKSALRKTYGKKLDLSFD